MMNSLGYLRKPSDKPWRVTISTMSLTWNHYVRPSSAFSGKKALLTQPLVPLDISNVLHTPSTWSEPAPGDPGHATRSHNNEPAGQGGNNGQGGRSVQLDTHGPAPHIRSRDQVQRCRHEKVSSCSLHEPRPESCEISENNPTRPDPVSSHLLPLYRNASWILIQHSTQTRQNKNLLRRKSVIQRMRLGWTSSALKFQSHLMRLNCVKSGWQIHKQNWYEQRNLTSRWG